MAPKRSNYKEKISIFDGGMETTHFEDNLINTMQIAADTSAAIFNGIKPGVRIEETLCFAPGTGVAGPQNKPYESVILSAGFPSLYILRKR
jgi:hypothetical protein